MKNKQTSIIRGQLVNEERKKNILAKMQIDDTLKEQIQEGDDDPLCVLMEIPEGMSVDDWYYTSSAIKDVARETENKKVNGYLGHQKPEDLPYEFKPVVTHWIGGLYQEEERNGKRIAVAYVYGVIDKSAEDLKRWIKTNRINQVSIYGLMTLEIDDDKDEIRCVGVELYSIDWTPLHRAGMDTKILGMENIKGLENKSKEDKETMNEKLFKKILIGMMATEETAEEKLKELQRNKQEIETLAGQMGKLGEKNIREGVEKIQEICKVLASEMSLDKALEKAKELTTAKTKGEMETKRNEALATVENEKLRKVAGEMLVKESDDFGSELKKLEENETFKMIKQEMFGRDNKDGDSTNNNSSLVEEETTSI